MKKYLLLLICSISAVTFSQNNPINFESGGFGADWTWTVFENDANPPLEIIANPDPSGINTSATVAKFTALQAGQPFAGVESMHGADIGTFSLSSENAIVKIKVWKSVISDVGIKFATAEGASTGEIKIANTLINQWEELTFDFNGVIGEPSSNDIDQIIVFPDFHARTEDQIIYFDSIDFGNSLSIQKNKFAELKIYPNPATDFITISTKVPIDSIDVFNLLGQIVLQIDAFNNLTTLNTSKLPEGTYFMKISIEGESKTYKLNKK